jgi:hypothetical protein
MTRERVSSALPNDMNAQLERAFIEQYLADRGFTLHVLHTLPPEIARELMAGASTFASSRLAEVEARAQFVDEVHGIAPRL